MAPTCSVRSCGPAGVIVHSPSGTQHPPRPANFDGGYARCSGALEDRGSIYASIAKAATLFLQEPKPPCRKNPPTQPWMDIDQPNAPWRAVDRIDYASQDHVKRFAA